MIEAEQLNRAIAAAFSEKPGWMIADQEPVPSYQQHMTRVGLVWPDCGATDEVFVRAYRGYMSWWTIEALDLPEREQAALQVAGRAGVPVPELLCLLRSGSETTAVLRRVAGEHLRPPISTAIATQLAEALARLHSAPIGAPDRQHLPDVSLPVLLPRLAAWAAEVEDAALRRSVDLIAEQLPAVEEQSPRLIHGDCHEGNILADGERIAAMIDWEEAALGDPRLDVVRVQARLEDCAPEVVDHFLHRYQELAGYSLGPPTLWWELTRLRDQIISAWVQRHLSQGRTLPSANPGVWING